MHLEIAQQAGQLLGQRVIVGIPESLILAGGQFGENRERPGRGTSWVVDCRVEQGCSKRLEVVEPRVWLDLRCGRTNEAVG